MKTRTIVTASMLALTLMISGVAWADAAFTPVVGNTYGSVEPIPNSAVVDTSLLRDTSLDVREAFAGRVVECGTIGAVIDALTSTGSISTIDDSNIHFDVVAGGFAGSTTAALGYTVVDSGPGAASHDDISVLTDSLGYVFSQGSAFLLDADDPSSFGFPANYVVLNFDTEPTLQQSAALFETVGAIDPELFETFTSGYTQFGTAYLSLQSAVPDQQFIDGYVQAAAAFGVEYTPIVGGQPSLFTGGADFPGNDWSVDTSGEGYLSRIPEQSHDELGAIRAGHLRVVDHALKVAQGRSDRSGAGLERALGNLPCRAA